MSKHVCGNCGVAIEWHSVCVSCAEGWQARPYAHFLVEGFGDGFAAVKGVRADGQQSPDLLTITVVAADHPMLEPTEAEYVAIHKRMGAFLALTTAELDTVLNATAKAAPALGVKLRRALGG